jgi:cell division protein ZapA (FtsZ GTPase activity inhibitor)
MWGTIIHFCSESVGPAKNDNLKYFKLGFTEDELKLDQKKFEDALRVQDDDGFVVWLSQLLFATSGRNSSDDQRIIEKYCKVAATFYQAIFSAFKERPKAVLRPQKHLFISYCGQDALAPPHVLPIRSTIHLRGGVQSVFGIPQAGDPLVLSWGEFCDAIGNQVYSRVWTTILSRIAVESCSGQFLDGRNVITSHDGHTLYRLILTACTSYANSRVELSLYVIEVLRKPDIAHNLYALLAKGLSMALRFRSLFLEDDSPFSSVNVLIGEKPLNKIAEEISDEIQHLNQDVNETISLPAAAYTKVMPADDLIAMSKKWRLIKERLVLAYSNAIDAPEMDQEKARQALVDALTELRKEIEPQNRLFIAAIAKKLTDLP